ncbi:MAG: hypothetical protein ACLT8H_09870 [Streptococcus parasanguinis]
MLKLSLLVQYPYNVKVDYYTPLTIEVTNIPPYSDKNYFRLVKMKTYSKWIGCNLLSIN